MGGVNAVSAAAGVCDIIFATDYIQTRPVGFIHKKTRQRAVKQLSVWLPPTPSHRHTLLPRHQMPCLSSRLNFQMELPDAAPLPTFNLD